MALWLVAVAALPVIAVLLSAERLFLLAGQDAAVADRAGAFLSVLAWGVVPAAAHRATKCPSPRGGGKGRGLGRDEGVTRERCAGAQAEGSPSPVGCCLRRESRRSANCF